MSQNNSQSQRFCLRWNNHQSNLLAVFDQLLTSEAFVDVTLAVEGQMLRAHKMVLSACSPYFQTLFVGHPDRHPIVILKDVPLVDMRSLLDFMYRGEVSVDQDRLAAFLKVAESLRIKGLTEVNEDRGDLPSLASSLLQSHSSSPSSSPVHNNQMVHVPQLQRIHNHSPMSLKRPLPSHPLHDQQRQQLSYPMNPLLGSALTAPKRKRGRPRKLSTGSNSPSRPSDNNNDDSRASTPIGTSAGSGRDPPDLLELNMSEESESAAAAPKYYDSPKDENTIEDEEMEEEFVETENGIVIKQEPSDPIPGTSQDLSTLKKDHDSQSSLQLDQSVCDMHNANMLKLLSRTDHDNVDGDRDNNNDARLTLASWTAAMVAEQKSKFSLVVSQHTSSYKPQLLAALDEEKRQMQESSQQQQNQQSTALRPPVKRRIRRRATSSSDPAEQLTEMSVRGLNLFRYATVSEGIYKCLECAKTDILKTFKNKYSFQRHAFLYHEGHQRKVFPCPVCAKEFSRPDKMKNHMKTVHECYMPKAIDFPQVPFLLPP
ncbi:protein tramtrack, alpha isoform-like isoform X1 [Daktulosphaira vitifoliae]|uniref:protein tramtrack, alpha isoform-like isoform X1 n=1 Tax=Daktulosphaira vitifoliae TaxID=58002 RepID=UPI0021A98321|nr:protein tramtrack, alpha isoform-like isoform X1 [Daktulosphaira vitifoliae]XP_050548923.1 protein tramtrack, alpha isoform-like isoform X1 [Daktulosphaira vitifoliae]